MNDTDQSDAADRAGPHPIPTVLVVDDSIAIRRILRRGLEAAGYRIVEAANGVDALAVCRSDPPALVLLDVDMPVMDGPTTLRVMKSDNDLSEIPVLFLTARTGASDAAVGLGLGAYDYLRKPCDSVELVARVALALRQKASTDALRKLAHDADQASEVDELTGLGNRRRLGRHRAEMEAMAGDAATLGVLMVDVDHFKQINDNEGHAAGDIVLKGLATRLRSTAANAGALPVRWGGEEFVVLALDFNIDRATELGEAVRAAISDAPLALGNSRTVAITVSVGCASGPLDHLEAILQAADIALYEAKVGGRDRVVAAASPG